MDNNNSAAKTEDSNQPINITQHIVARPPYRTQFNVDDWRNAINSAELMYTPNRVALYDLYADVELDPVLARQWEKRVDKITTLNWMFNKDGEKVEGMQELISCPAFEMLLKEIMNTTKYGISVLELAKEKKTVFGKSIEELVVYCTPRKHIHPEAGIIVKEQYDAPVVNIGDSGQPQYNALGDRGIAYREMPYVNFCAEIGEPKDLGVLMQVVPYVLLKKGAVSDWALFVQLFGQPLREYTYSGYNPTEKAELEQSAKEMASAPYIILPDGAKVTLHDIKTNPNGKTHETLVKYCDEMLSIRILGSTETTSSSESSGYAQSAVHAQTDTIAYNADKKRVLKVLNDKIKPLLFNLGYPSSEGEFAINEDQYADETIKQLQVVQSMKLLGTPVADDYIYEISGVPKPEDYDVLKAKIEAVKNTASESNGKVVAKTVEEPPAETAPEKKASPKEKEGDKKLTTFEQFRLYMADFFAQAPNR